MGQSGIASPQVALTDSMMVSVQLINDQQLNGDGVDCLIDEVLLWKGQNGPMVCTVNGHSMAIKDVSDVTTMDCSSYQVSANSSNAGSGTSIISAALHFSDG